jgi:hypothetical protein
MSTIHVEPKQAVVDILVGDAVLQVPLVLDLVPRQVLFSGPSADSLPPILDLGAVPNLRNWGTCRLPRLRIWPGARAFFIRERTVSHLPSMRTVPIRFPPAAAITPFAPPASGGGGWHHPILIVPSLEAVLDHGLSGLRGRGTSLLGFSLVAIHLRIRVSSVIFVLGAVGPGTREGFVSFGPNFGEAPANPIGPLVAAFRQGGEYPKLFTALFASSWS